MRRVAANRTVTYELTDLGRGLLDVLTAVYAWTDRYWAELLDAQDAGSDTPS